LMSSPNGCLSGDGDARGDVCLLGLLVARFPASIETIAAAPAPRQTDPTTRDDRPMKITP
ncbi:MAG: hypothetical protein ACREGK_11415, partial [Geminicoccales bacterium]